MPSPASTVYARLYLEGAKVPSVVTVTLPDLTQMVEEFTAMGIAGAVNAPKVGHFEPMEMTIQPRSYVTEIETQLRYNERTTVELRAAIAEHDAAGGAVSHFPRIINATVIRKSRTSDEAEQGREEGPEYVCDVLYYREELRGQLIHEIDPLNLIAVHNGNDLLADVRAIIGG